MYKKFVIVSDTAATVSHTSIIDLPLSSHASTELVESVS